MKDLDLRPYETIGRLKGLLRCHTLGLIDPEETLQKIAEVIKEYDMKRHAPQVPVSLPLTDTVEGLKKSVQKVLLDKAEPKS